MSEDITALLPHRPPMLLVDRVVARGPGRLVAERTVTPGDPWLRAGGFPDALLLESWLQAAALLFGTGGAGLPVVGAVTGVRVLRAVGAEDVLRHEVRVLARTDDTAVFDGETTTKGQPVLAVERAVVARRPASAVRRNGGQG
ncbi:3-hydroxyacyl-ACP dehydratase FabZ family protein [Goodfellowiella coeruleoviolacea]|uniref:3-hydroxyacyl-[acyl-carrier-protein] dehydratase n=1 Tax=Goodfellowiella coeruleoviolacea TaxID=334858 RepID=A0AAE3GGS5_9PSEU|nr:hypothetical protein [Goodfellowiella coeruleoviolacea]MCP2167070.1 3-hydroxyacyl-[acyl-carrier-protein] dehydratase [Goodfellowiella coeruleoviolacea]